MMGKGGTTATNAAALSRDARANHPHFPSTVVRPGVPYRSKTVFAFTNAGIAGAGAIE
jgi:hypothetical protein